MEKYKDYIIEREKTFCHFVIKYDGTGSIPKELQGYFTKKSLAQSAIDAYIASKPPVSIVLREKPVKEPAKEQA